MISSSMGNVGSSVWGDLACTLALDYFNFDLIFWIFASCFYLHFYIFHKVQSRLDILQ